MAVKEHIPVSTKAGSFSHIQHLFWYHKCNNLADFHEHSKTVVALWWKPLHLWIPSPTTVHCSASSAQLMATVVSSLWLKWYSFPSLKTPQPFAGTQVNIFIQSHLFPPELKLDFSTFKATIVHFSWSDRADCWHSNCYLSYIIWKVSARTFTDPLTCSSHWCRSVSPSQG